MIIKRVTIRDWRGLREFDAELSSGLNVVRGRNEAGKSSVVEAIAWALHRDLVGPRIKDEISLIIPAHDSNAKPCVELELEFPDCAATIRKTLAADSSARECCLVVRRAGVADQTRDQSKAQNELRHLMASDGASGAASTSGIDVSLLVSAQGQSTQFVGQELSSSARSSVALGEDGAIAPTSRLEKVRSDLEKKRGRELFERLKPNAVDAAKKQTEAARLREELETLREEHAKYSAVEAQIASLRAQIKNILEQYQSVAPRAEATKKEWDTLRETREAQIMAEAEVAEKRRAHDEAKSRRDEVQRRTEEIMQLREASTRAATEWQQLGSALEAARENNRRWQERTTAMWEAHAAAEKEEKDARQIAGAWDRYQEVCAASRDRKRWRERLEQLESLGREVETKKAEMEALGRAPVRAQIARWREQYFVLETLRQAVAQTLKITLHLEHDAALKFRADESGTQSLAAQAGEEVLLGAQSNLALHLAGVGKFFVSNAERSAQKQSAELEAKTRLLEKDLSTFDISIADLPSAFEKLEEACSAFEMASQNLQWSDRQLGSTLAGGESLESAREQLQMAEAEYKRAREACEPFRALIPEGVKPAQANIERERARENERQAHDAAERARRAWQQSLARQNEYSQEEGGLAARVESLEKTRAQNASRLAELENDGLDDNACAFQLDQLNEALWRFKGERDVAIKNREAMGTNVTSETLARIEHEVKELRDEQHRLEKEVGEKRAELRMYCEQDPQTAMEKLQFEIEARETGVARHESRLRGLAILEAALEAERHRLGRAIAAPLNEYLSPWLSDLRGKKTRVEFDENTGRLTGVQTGENGSTHVLPFASHSGGMQEQTALALRLILAQAAAKKLSSGKLPLVLDDPLTQSDTQRRDGLWRVLREAAKHLQIIFVTCHETHLPEKIEAQFVTLGEWQTRTPVQPIVSEEKTKSKRKSKIKVQANGHAPKKEKEAADTLSLW